MGADRDHVYGTGVPIDVRVGSALERLAVAAERIADSLGVIAATPRASRATSLEEREAEILARIEQLQRELAVVSLHRRADLVEDRLKCAMDPESLSVESVPAPAPVPALTPEGDPLSRLASREARVSALFAEAEDLMRDFPPPPAWTVPVNAPPVPGLPSWAVPAFRHLAPRRGGPFDRAPSEIPVSVRRAPGVVAAPAGSAWPPSDAVSSDEGER